MTCAVAAACVPDLDLVLRFVVGGHHHRGPSHSLGAALCAGVVAAALARLSGWPRAGRLGLVVATAWASHLVLDLLGSDTNPPLGILALWPFDSGWYKAPVVLFLDIGRTLDLSTVRQNLIAAAWEIALLLPIVSGAVWFRQRES